MKTKRSYEIRKVEVAPDDFDFEVYLQLKPTFWQRLSGQPVHEWTLGRFKELKSAEAALAEDLRYPITRWVNRYDKNGNKDLYFPF